MPRPSFFETHFGRPLSEFVAQNHEQRASVLRTAVPDLHFFLDNGVRPDERPVPERTRALVRGLVQAIEAATPADDAARRSLPQRVITDAQLRGEADRDQNVYLGALFTRTLTQATPDLVFLPATMAEAAAALRWARADGVPVTLRGAASTAMGGAVPNDGGLTLDLSRLDHIDVDEAGRVCVLGAGARLRIVHQRLAARGLALRAYPSNLGGTLAGWFVTGGIGLNAFGRGRAVDTVRAADVLLPSGEHVRFHDDGRLDVPGDGAHRLTLPAPDAETWFTTRGLQPLALADLAGSEGVFGLLMQLTVSVEPRADLGAFLLSFAQRDDALAAAAWVAGNAGERFPAPANVKLFSGSHLHHVRRVWQDEDAREWRRAPGALSSSAALPASDGGGGSTSPRALNGSPARDAGDGAHSMPWRSIAGPAELGAACGADHAHAAAYLFVDWLGLDGARAFAASVADCPGSPRVLDAEGIRVAAERFRPQQTKRLGPGLLAAEIVMPARRVPEFLPRAERLAAGAGVELDAEVYYLADGSALVIAGYLTDHRRGSFGVDLTVAPALVDLAMNGFDGQPYVLGRWQSAWFERRFGAGAARVRAVRAALDPTHGVNRGVLTGLRLRGPLGGLLTSTFEPGIALLRGVYDTPAASWLARLARGVMSVFPGPAAGHGAPAAVGARFRTGPPVAPGAGPDGSILLPIAPRSSSAPGVLPILAQTPEDRAVHCVNCGECNTVCPIYHESRIRLPQMLTHAGEAMRAGTPPSDTTRVLLDLCMRCGNCEEVCQAGIPHLPLYERMQLGADAVAPRDEERHTAIVAAVRSSPIYRREFLDVRPGGYLKRSPASLPGVPRYMVMRSENDAGPAATCIHCGACVSVCPTHANREFEGADPRWITTVQNRCIGCGTCVEICPANLANGGQTLRVMEAPTPDWFVALSEFASGSRDTRAPEVSRPSAPQAGSEDGAHGAVVSGTPGGAR